MHAKIVKVLVLLSVILVGAAIAACTAVQPLPVTPQVAAAPAAEPAVESAAVAAAVPITVLVSELPPVLDPYTATSRGAAYILAQLYDAPLYIGSDGQLLAGLAQAVDIAPTRTEYTLTLRPGLVFHDGTPLAAESLVAAWRRGVALDQSHWSAASSVDAIDPLTVRVTLPAPKDDFLQVDVARWLVVKENPGAEGAGALIGSGPYMLGGQTADTLTLAPNSHHWEEPDAAAGDIILRSEADAAAALEAVAAGRANLALDLSDADIAGLQETKFLKIIQPRFPEFAALTIVNVLPADVDRAALHAFNRADSYDPLAAVGVLKALNLQGNAPLLLACSATAAFGQEACADVAAEFNAAGIDTEVAPAEAVGAAAEFSDPLALLTYYSEPTFANVVNVQGLDAFTAVRLSIIAQAECPGCDIINPLTWPPPPPPPPGGEVLVVRQ